MDAGGASLPVPRQQPPLSVDTHQRVGASMEELGEPLSPTARLFQDLYIVAIIGLGTPIDFKSSCAGLEATLLQHPRFCSIRVMDDGTEPRWVRTTVNMTDHIITPDLDPAAISTDPDKVVEDYVASLSTLPMDQSRPLWEVHALDFPTSEAASTVAFRFHHALGDGTSLVSLLLACTRSAADPTAVPAMPAPPRRRGPIYALPRPTRSAGAKAFAAWALSYILLAWHTVVDVARFFTSVLLVSDPRTVFSGVKGAEFRGKRFVSRGLSLEDVKHVRNALGCTINDVLVGVTSAALSRYYFRKQDHATKGVCLRSILTVNTRTTPGLHKLAKMMENGKHNDVKWGNQVGYIVLPFYISMHDDPLEYIRKAKKVVDRKKNSLEAIFTHVAAETVTRLFGVKVSGALFHRMLSNTTFVFSSVIGTTEKIEFYGQPVVYVAPFVCGNPSALNVAWLSYGKNIRITLTVDDAQIPDSHQLLDDFAESLGTIREATSTAL